MDLAWFYRRARAMSVPEVLARVGQYGQTWYWRRRFYNRKCVPVVGHVSPRRVLCDLNECRQDVPRKAKEALLAAADELIAGRWSTFAVQRGDVSDNIDWHFEPKAIMRPSDLAYSFDIAIHGTKTPFDPKYVWELSRHHQTTVLAMAYWLTDNEQYAERAAELVESWCRANPFLHGIHWSSGIELGIRLISFVWTRRLLDRWPKVACHFEESDVFVETLGAHLWWLAHRMSSGSSANNHLIYEAAGLYIAARNMPWFEDCGIWEARATQILTREFDRQLFASGLNREQASGYHLFLLEAVLLCLVEATRFNREAPESWWQSCVGMLGARRSTADCEGRGPRYGDCDDAHGLLLDAPGFDRERDIQALSNLLLGGSAAERGDADLTLRTWLWSRLLHIPNSIEMRDGGDGGFLDNDAGIVILRTADGQKPEFYCAFDAGPLGYLSLAAHGHADALAVEVRVGGHPILADPGTYTYAATSPWRDYFRSTAAHNTIELGGQSQSVRGGPFLWTRHARARLVAVQGVRERDRRWAFAIGEQDGYRTEKFRGRHRRTVTLDRALASLEIVDEISASRQTAMRAIFHLHPSVTCNLAGTTAILTWRDGRSVSTMTMELPDELSWTLYCASEAPRLGWYSPSYDVMLPTVSLAGSGVLIGDRTLRTRLFLSPVDQISVP